MNNLGDRLKELRQLNNMTQSEFAQKMQTTQQRVSEWECGKVEPSISNVVKILKIYNVTFEELIDSL